jgi:hypothetical protein
MLEPTGVLLDEPTLGLDPASLAVIGDSVRAMITAGTTILMVEQNVRFGLSLATHAAVLTAGTVALAGPAAEIAAHRLLAVLSQGSCWIKLSGAHRVAKDKPLRSVTPWGGALVTARPDRLIWGSGWPHLPNGQRDTGEILNLLADWAPTDEARQEILVSGPTRLFFA